MTRGRVIILLAIAGAGAAAAIVAMRWQADGLDRRETRGRHRQVEPPGDVQADTRTIDPSPAPASGPDEPAELHAVRGSSVRSLLSAAVSGPAMRAYGNLLATIALFGEQVERSPVYWRTLAKFALDDRRIDEAERHLKRALELNPESAATHVGLGLVEIGRAPPRLAEAQAHLERAVELDPNNADALYNLGVVQHRRQRFHDAEKTYIRVVASQPDNFQAWFNLAGISTYYGRLSEARVLWERAVQLRPGSAEARYQLALTYLQLKMPDEAIEQFQLLAKDQPRDADVLSNLGLAWQLKKDDAKAMLHFEQAHKLAPENVVILNNLADLHLVLHQRDPQQGKHLPEALRLWEQSLRLKPEQPRIENMIRYFRSQ